MDTSQASFFTAVVIVSITVGTIIIFFIMSMIRQHRRNIELYKAKLKAEVTTLEKERARVAADLHDELGPLLFTVKFKISSIDTNAEDQQMLEQAGNYIDDIIKRIREISNDLMPGTLVRKGVIFAMEEFIDGIAKLTTLDIKFTHEGIPELAKDNAINLYRIMQEIIHNTLKHSKATGLNIQLTRKADNILLLTQDNGVGFNYNDAINKHKGLGLQNLLSRTEIMKGDLQLDTVPGQGTKFIIEFPIA